MATCQDCEQRPALHERTERDARGRLRTTLLCSECAFEWDSMEDAGAQERR